MRSLRGRLAVVWLLSLAASVAVAVLMAQLYARSSTQAVRRASDEVSRGCEQVRDAWRYYGTGWAGPPPSGDDEAFRADLRSVLSLALADYPGLRAGVWRSEGGLLASVPADPAKLPPVALWQPLAAGVAASNRDDVQRGEDAGDTVVMAACVLPVAGADLVAWTARRLSEASGLAELRAGFGVLLALVLAITGWLTWLVAGWSRHVGRIEAALAGHAAGDLPLLPATGERELDRIVAALNLASVRLAASRREATTLAERAAEAERMAALGRVAAGVAHEIRNPIAAMRLRAENALAGDDARRRMALNTILGQVERLDRLSGELLAMTQGRAPERAPVELAALLEAVRRDHEDAAMAADIRLEARAPAGVTVDLDATMLARALANLVGNALRATARGGSVSLTGDVDAAGALTIEVRDSGTGVAPEIRDRMFEPFVTGRADGTGLGLAIAREMVAAHGGSLVLADTGADDAPGGGARFVIGLPACRRS